MSEVIDASEKFVLYTDECYHYSWVYPEARKKIIDYFTSNERKDKKFKILGANNLKNWMANRIENGDANKTVIVFTQDMVPEVLAPDFSPSIIMRTYLDCGGRIVWIGDVPFFRQGKYLKDLNTLTSEQIAQQINKISVEWGIGGVFSILGLNVEFNYSPTAKVEITDSGKKWGLRESNEWYGTRPIAENGDNIDILAKSSAKRYKPPELLKPEEKKDVVESLAGITSKISAIAIILLAFFTAFFTLYSTAIGQTLPPWLQPLLLVVVSLVLAALFLSLPKIQYMYSSWKKSQYPNAWIKNFNSNYPDSGFIRIWDTIIYDLKKSEIEDLFTLAIHNL